MTKTSGNDIRAMLAGVAAYGLAGTRRQLAVATLDTTTWNDLLEAAAAEQLTGLLVASLSDEVLPATDTQLEQAASRDREAAITAVMLERLLLQIAERFDTESIEYRVLKGAAHAHLDYTEPRLRCFRTIDILIRAADLDNAVAALTHAGGRRSVPELRPDFDSRFGKGVRLVMPDDRDVGLHRTFVAGPLGSTVDLDGLFESSSPFMLADRKLEGLATEERFVHSCFDVGLGRPAGLVEMRDLAQLVLGDELDVDRALELARRWQAPAVVARAVNLTWSTLDLADAVPLSAWASHYRPDRHEERVIDAYVGGDRSYTRQALAMIRVLHAGATESPTCARCSFRGAHISPRGTGAGLRTWVVPLGTSTAGRKSPDAEVSWRGARRLVPEHFSSAMMRRSVTLAVLGLCATSCSHDSGRSRAAARSAPTVSSSATTSTAAPPTGTAPTVPAARRIRGSRVQLPRLPSGGVVAVPATIPADCSIDVTRALEAWIERTPDNTTLRFGRRACYRIDETIVITRRHRLLFDGNGATLRAFTGGTRTRAQLYVSEGSDITVQNLTLRGANPDAGAHKGAYVPALEGQAGFWISGAARVHLDGIAVFDTYGDFVYIGSAHGRPSADIAVERSRFSRSGRQGITVTSGINIAIADNVIAEAARSLIDLEANTRTASIRRVDILRNATGAAPNFWLANKGHDASIGDISVVGNHMSTATGGLVFVYGENVRPRGPYLFESNRFIAADRTHDEHSSGAFFFAYAERVTIHDNSVTFSPGTPAVELRGTHHVAVTQNHFRGAGTVLLPRDGSSDYHVS